MKDACNSRRMSELLGILSTAAIAFIYLTAKADRADRERGLELGANGYLTKPFTLRELREAVAAQLA